MLPAPSFKQAIQRTVRPGDEAAVMGPYLPKGSYTTKAKFERRAIPAPPGSAPAVWLLSHTAADRSRLR